jgi:hypothetical protein
LWESNSGFWWGKKSNKEMSASLGDLSRWREGVDDMEGFSEAEIFV